MRLKAFPTSILARLLPNTATIKRIPAGSDPDARTTILTSLRCDDPQWLDQEQKERAGLAAVARLARVKTAVPTAAVKVRDVFVLDSTEYRVRAVSPVPVANAAHYELLIEEEA